MERRVASFELRGARCVSGGRTALRSSRHSPLAARPYRPGISLLEVLISMFVLLFGLMGVASIFPVGNHHAGKGDQYDRGAAMTEAAFAELHARGMLRPEYWIYAPNAPNSIVPVIAQTGGYVGMFLTTLDSNPSQPHPGHAFVIDPLGSAYGALRNEPKLDAFPQFDAATGAAANDTNPWRRDGLAGPNWPIRRVTLLQTPGQLITSPVAETIFRLRDDLTNELPKEGDRPGIQRWAASDPNNTPKVFTDDVPLQRAYAGSYSWLATVAPTAVDGVANLQPALGMTGSAQYEVAVAVFFKRLTTPNEESERAITARLYPGGELEMHHYDPAVLESALNEIRSGQWIALAGVSPINGQFVLKWYRLLSLDGEASPYNGDFVRRAMLDGPEWPMAPGTTAATNLRAILLPGVINVSTQVVTMERN